jgi:2-polyprenyl-3-methyl-5-hydroxy-6-metoxy-1,4-benzoquinol methylase
MIGPSAAPAASERLCPWCAAPLSRHGEDTGVVRCVACGVGVTDPWPTDGELDRAYADWYRPDSGRFSGIGDSVLSRTRGLLAGRVDRIAPAGPVLDVGAGDGGLLRALRAVGREAQGIERFSSAPGVLTMDLSEVEGSWAAIVFWHSLEHLRAPADALAHAAKLLLPHGVIIVAVPNGDSLQARTFGRRWLALDLPRHLVHLPAPRLTARLERLGLRVERVSHWRGGQLAFGWLHGFVASLPGGLDLYDAIRRPEARSKPMSARHRLAALAAGVLLLPIAWAAAAIETVARRGGSVYVEARRR